MLPAQVLDTDPGLDILQHGDSLLLGMAFSGHGPPQLGPDSTVALVSQWCSLQGEGQRGRLGRPPARGTRTLRRCSFDARI